MASAGRRFLKGLIKGGRGVTQAWVNALIAEDERKKEEKEAERQARVDALNRRNIESLIEKREQPAERKGFALGAGQKRFEFDEETGEFKEVAAVAPKPTKPTKEKRPEDVTGIGEFEDVVTKRRTETEKARKTFAETLKKSLPEIPFKGTTPEELRKEALAFLPQEQVVKVGEGEEDALTRRILETMKLLGEPPPEFEIPGGKGAVALADSIEAARQDPALAAELLRFQPGAKGAKPKGKVPSMQEFTDMLKGQKAAGQTIKWDEIAKDFPAIDIDELKRLVGE